MIWWQWMTMQCSRSPNKGRLQQPWTDGNNSNLRLIEESVDATQLVKLANEQVWKLYPFETSQAILLELKSEIARHLPLKRTSPARPNETSHEQTPVRLAKHSNHKMLKCHGASSVTTNGCTWATRWLSKNESRASRSSTPKELLEGQVDQSGSHGCFSK